MNTNFDAYNNLGSGILSVAVSIAATLILLVGLWKMFAKAGEPGWASIIPIYNTYLLFKMTWGKGSKFLFLLIPIYNIVVLIQTHIKLAKAFGKSGGFVLGLIFLTPIFYAILGFDDSEYLGVPEPTSKYVYN